MNILDENLSVLNWTGPAKSANDAWNGVAAPEVDDHPGPDGQTQNLAGPVLQLQPQDERGPYQAELRRVFDPAHQGAHLDEAQWPAPMLSRLCADALHAGIEIGYVSGLIAQRDLHPHRPDLLLWPWPLRVYTLGRFSLVRAGEAVTFAGKSPRKPLEMLQVLIALGGRDVDVWLVMHALWPEDRSSDLRKLFDNTLLRLRLMLGLKDAVSLRNGKLSLDLNHCWVDAWAFDRLVGRVCVDDKFAPERVRDARQLYQGHFLQREAGQLWLVSYRERLRARYHRLVLADGARLEALEDWEGAAQVYGQALEIDSLTELLHRRLMHCHLALGEFAEALCVYRRCSDLLSIGLGVQPSQATEAIRRQIENV
jgi:LuxR family maltose regulon positive regulatory protein